MEIFFHLGKALLYAIPGWCELVSLALCIGILTSVFWIIGLTHREGSFQVPNHLLGLMWYLLSTAGVVMIAAGTAELFWQAHEMTGRSLSELFPILPTVILRTHIGHMWLIRILALVAFLLTLSRWNRNLHLIAGAFLLMSLMAIVCGTRSLSGHAADMGNFTLATLSDWLHLSAASVWGGGLVALSLIVLPRLLRDPSPPLIAAVVRRFSRAAGIAVVILALTSLFNARLFVGSVEGLWTYEYGWIVTIKIFLLVVLLFFGALNRYERVPRLQLWARISQGKNPGILHRMATYLLARFEPLREGSAIAVHFTRSIRVEAVLILAVLLCATLLRHGMPIRHHLQHYHSEEEGYSSGMTTGADSPHQMEQQQEK